MAFDSIRLDCIRWWRRQKETKEQETARDTNRGHFAHDKEILSLHTPFPTFVSSSCLFFQDVHKALPDVVAELRRLDPEEEGSAGSKGGSKSAKGGKKPKKWLKWLGLKPLKHLKHLKA